MTCAECNCRFTHLQKDQTMIQQRNEKLLCVQKGRDKTAVVQLGSERQILIVGATTIYHFLAKECSTTTCIMEPKTKDNSGS